MGHLLRSLIARLARVKAHHVGLALMLVGALDLWLEMSPAALALPGARVDGYLITAAILSLALALLRSWWRWCALILLLSALWLVSDDHWRGIVDRNELYRLKEQGLIRMHEREIRDLQAKWRRERGPDSSPSTQPREDGP